MTFQPIVGGADADLDKRLADGLDAHNAPAAGGTIAAELTVRINDDAGELAAGISGWTWQEAAGIGMTWVRADLRGKSLGSRLLTAFEEAARERGAQRIFVSSFTFQAPEFYERHGYREIFRWEGVPATGQDDVFFRKEL